jgi:hypothetical protein
MRDYQDKDNLCPDYQFILNNLDILTADINFRNIGKMFPERKKVSYMQNQKLVDFVKQIRRDVSEGRNEFIYFNAHQWELIENKLKETKSVI